MSIQLLPKLFSSFQQFVATGHGPHWVTTWANRELNMMELFFDNIMHFVESLHGSDVNSNSLYSPVEEVQARLQYLSSVFSCELSQQDFSKLRVLPTFAYREKKIVCAPVLRLIHKCINRNFNKINVVFDKKMSFLIHDFFVQLNLSGIKCQGQTEIAAGCYSQGIDQQNHVRLF